jgi:hypothetical protein
VQEPRVTPTPQPSPSIPPKRNAASLKKLGKRILNFLACNKAKESEEQRLFRRGPQLLFPDVYNESDFSIVALVKGNWGVAVEYELEPRSTASITFKVKDVAPFTQALPANNVVNNPQTTQVAATGRRQLFFILPKQFGEKPQAALISLRAVIDDPNGKVAADFQLDALALGGRALVPATTTQPGTQTDQLGTQTDVVSVLQKASAQEGFELLSDFGRRQAGAPNEVAIIALNVAPTSVSARQGGMFNYNFLSTNFFEKWRAEYRQEVKTLGPGGKYVKGTKYVGGKTFYEPVLPLFPKYQNWIISRGGRFSQGKYKIQVYAWFSVNARGEGGEWATRISRPPVSID